MREFVLQLRSVCRAARDTMCVDSVCPRCDDMSPLQSQLVVDHMLRVLGASARWLRVSHVCVEEISVNAIKAVLAEFPAVAAARIHTMRVTTFGAVSELDFRRFEALESLEVITTCVHDYEACVLRVLAPVQLRSFVMLAGGNHVTLDAETWARLPGLTSLTIHMKNVKYVLGQLSTLAPLEHLERLVIVGTEDNDVETDVGEMDDDAETEVVPDLEVLRGMPRLDTLVLWQGECSRVRPMDLGAALAAAPGLLSLALAPVQVQDDADDLRLPPALKRVGLGFRCRGSWPSVSVLAADLVNCVVHPHVLLYMMSPLLYCDLSWTAPAPRLEQIVRSLPRAPQRVVVPVVHGSIPQKPPACVSHLRLREVSFERGCTLLDFH
jgi:hypothetical protein